MNTQERERFQENEACEGCPHLQKCREGKEPRRTSCWIRFCRDRYWKPQLGKEKRK